MALLTIEELEEAVGTELYVLVSRLVREYREHGNVTRPPFVREPGALADVTQDLQTVVNDCQLLWERKQAAMA